MIKKITLLVLMTLTIIFTANQIHGAVDTIEIPITDQLTTWTLDSNGGVYYLESNRILNGAEDISFELGQYVEHNSLDPIDAFVLSEGSETSRIVEYTTASTSTVAATYELEAEEVNIVTSHQEITDGNYYSIIIVLEPTLTSDERDDVLDAFNDNSTYFVGFMELTAFTYIVNINPGNESDRELLPTTNGSIFDDINQMGDVHSIVVDGYDLSFIMEYDKFYYIDYTFSENTDMSIFNDNYEAFYYTKDDTPFIVLNHGTQSMFTSDNFREQTFIPYTIWNLETNELATFNKASVNIYLTVSDANHIVGYFYMDDFVIDNLKSVSMIYDYRYDPLVGSKGEWITEGIILEDTGISEGNIGWQLEGAATSAASTLLVTGGLIAAGVSWPVTLPVFLIGAGITTFFYATTQDFDYRMTVGDVNQIEPYSPSLTFQQELNAKYKATNEDFEGLDLDTFQMFKLDLGAYNKSFNTVEVNDETVEVIEMVYQTDGKVYVLDTDSLQTHASVDDYLDQDNDSTLGDPAGNGSNINFTIPDNIGWYILGAAVILIFGKPIIKKAQKEPIFGLILLGGVVYLLYYVGLIKL